DPGACPGPYTLPPFRPSAGTPAPGKARSADPPGPKPPLRFQVLWRIRVSPESLQPAPRGPAGTPLRGEVIHRLRRRSRDTHVALRVFARRRNGIGFRSHAIGQSTSSSSQRANREAMHRGSTNIPVAGPGRLLVITIYSENGCRKPSSFANSFGRLAARMTP